MLRLTFRRLLTAFLFSPLAVAIAAGPQFSITEFMADNGRTLASDDGSYEDWIEVRNNGATAADLGGWYLTDTATNLTMWRFPSTNVAPGGFLVVFASGRDKRVAGTALHTNFKLSATGEYLALVAPDGVSAATSFAPAYPPQYPDVSFGFGATLESAKLVATNNSAQILVPTDGALALDWTLPGFDDSAWTAGRNGIGYETGNADPQESSYSVLVAALSPLAYWRFSETSGAVAANNGSLGADGNASYLNGALQNIPGPRPPQYGLFEANNTAARFDGVDDFVGGPAPLLNDRAAFALAGWIRPTATQGSRTGLFGQNDAVEFGFIDASTIQLWTFFGSVNVTYPFKVNEWHHLVALGTPDKLEIYFDGALAGSSGASGQATYGSSGDNFNIGGGGVFDASGNPFHGDIDEVAIWDRALTAAEITQLAKGPAASVDFTPYISTDVKSAMFGHNASALVRIPFVVTNTAGLTQLLLQARYDDGFVAWLNGQEIARKQAPDPVAWNSTATDRHPDNLAAQFEEIDVTPALDFLEVGTNFLALQGLNIATTNRDFMVQAELVARSHGLTAGQGHYFSHPTPGAENTAGTNDAGPLVREVLQSPPLPAPGDALVITTRIVPTLHLLAGATLHYRVMFNAEIATPMNDAGTGGDQIAGDGIWTATIPAAAKGQMVRYYITATDNAGNASRWPLYQDPADSAQYLGTVVQDAGIESALPVVQSFLERPSSADTTGGTRCALYFLGEFYDNVLMSLHGQSSSGFPKKSYNLAFTSDHSFKYQTGGKRVKNLRLLTNYGDKSKTHNALGYEMIA
ncbi:MAG TPA: LamG-like jellyroll fold domain-containing protein, partial [Verrucomicrobiae bacterium]|nr:LamG-like jellyroll fold domain-containing protein [Verrucomicrobiae bacterium]